jgi:hypothetical protein
MKGATMPDQDEELLDQVERVRKDDPSLEEKLERYRRDRAAYEKQVRRSDESGVARQTTPHQRSTRWQQAGYTRDSSGGTGSSD